MDEIRKRSIWTRHVCGKTGYSVTQITSVSIFSDNCALCCGFFMMPAGAFFCKEEHHTVITRKPSFNLWFCVFAFLHAIFGLLACAEYLILQHEVCVHTQGITDLNAHQLLGSSTRIARLADNIEEDAARCAQSTTIQCTHAAR